MKEVPDNIVWHALAGPHARFAAGTAELRRYAVGFSPIIGFSDPKRANVDALTPFCEPGEHFYCEGWYGKAPDGWSIDVEAPMLGMIFDAPMPVTDEAPEAVRLDERHMAQAAELVALTKPGPFGPRNFELGEYFGIFEADRLVAMAGERLHAGRWREISAVCTHPDFQRRGLARRLMTKLVRREMQRDEAPCLHVMHNNHGARRVYEQMGFRVCKESVVRIVSRDRE
ncbi:MAG TPA: GNAT family N-acetyltransferase [Casimicrobiaceae bacterium]|nr:GNAT family N-acetyltransferase [Casimicrobiaceae bacterium]